ncbi:hypothetical protein Q9565_001395 [Salmonella enterica]|nr:hypothetical protein [Salmonella enterica]
MNEFHRWTGERLKEPVRVPLRKRRLIMTVLVGFVSLLGIGELVFVVWVMSGGTH